MGRFPGPHVQCLLELLLSAQQSLNIRKSPSKQIAAPSAPSASASPSPATKANDGDKPTNAADAGDDDANDDELRKLYNECYTKYRNGSSKLSMISLSKETISKSMTLTVTRDAQNRYLIDDFVADCCVSGGGKWYYEVTFVGQCQYTCIGLLIENIVKHQIRDYQMIMKVIHGYCWSKYSIYASIKKYCTNQTN